MRKLFSSKTGLLLSFIVLMSILAIEFFIKYKNENTSPAKRHSNTITYGSSIKNNPYRLHVQVGKELVGKPFTNDREVLDASGNGNLRRIKSGRGIIIDDLTHSLPYLHPAAAEILEEIGKLFHEKTNGNKLVINSLTRSIEGQKALTKTNLNASPNTSSHSYAVSFDIAYSKFNRNRSYQHESHRTLELILKEFQKKNKIYVIREKQSACYHITARKKADWSD